MPSIRSLSIPRARHPRGPIGARVAFDRLRRATKPGQDGRWLPGRDLPRAVATRGRAGGIAASEGAAASMITP